MSRIYKKKYLIEDYKGKKISHWLVTGETKIIRYKSSVKYHEKRGSYRCFWEVICDCGNKQWIRNASLINGKSKGCRSCSHTLSDNFYEVKSWYVSQIKGKAKKRNIEFNVSMKYLQELWEKQKGVCALSGLPIILGNKFSVKQTASLDRVDSSRGYIEGNLQWLHKDVNKMKLAHSQEKFIELCNLVTKYMI